MMYRIVCKSNTMDNSPTYIVIANDYTVIHTCSDIQPNLSVHLSGLAYTAFTDMRTALFVGEREKEREMSPTKIGYETSVDGTEWHPVDVSRLHRRLVSDTIQSLKSIK